MTNGQMRYDVSELALVGREIGKALECSPGQGTERAWIMGRKPQHRVAEPGRPVQLEVESTDRREQALKLDQRSFADLFGRHEREQHRDVRRDAKLGAGVEAFSMLAHDRFSGRDLHDQATARTRIRHARTLPG